MWATEKFSNALEMSPQEYGVVKQVLASISISEKEEDTKGTT